MLTINEEWSLQGLTVIQGIPFWKQILDKSTSTAFSKSAYENAAGTVLQALENPR